MRLDLFVRGKVVANLALGLTDETGHLSTIRAALDAAVERDVGRRGTAVRRTLGDPALTGKILVVGGPSFDRLSAARTSLGLDAGEQDLIARATNAQLASEWADLRLGPQPVTVVVPVVPRGGINSAGVSEHAKSLWSAFLLAVVMAGLRLAGSKPQVRLSTVVLPVVLAWLGYETWWRWHHRSAAAHVARAT